MSRAYVIDKDGTLVQQGVAVPGAADWIQSLNAKRIPYVVLSNTGECSAEEVRTGLGTVLATTSVRHVHTAADQLTAELDMAIDDGVFDHVFVVGRPPAKRQWTVLPTEVTCPKRSVVALFSDGRLDNFCDLVATTAAWVEAGATFWATSSDASITTASNLKRPGPGVFLQAVELTLGRHVVCRVVGKGGNAQDGMGERAMTMLREQGFKGGRRDVLMVGDRYDTDVRMGCARGWSTCLVESGCHTLDDHSLLFPSDVADRVALSVACLVDDAPTSAASAIADLVREALRRIPHSRDLAGWMARHLDTIASRIDAHTKVPPRRIRSMVDVRSN